MTAEHLAIDGPALLAAFQYATRHLRDSAAAIDAINEYPVPDGDTGSNMSMTLDQAVGEAEQVASGTVAGVLNSLARGALVGARGNSGGILSQSLRGLATGIGDVETIDARTLANGLTEAAKAAYGAVSNPSEGTMLTVLRGAGERAAEMAADLPNNGAGEPCITTFRGAIEAAEVAEANTINQLIQLQEAGVPDAGGEGICVILRGLLAAFTGTVAPAPVLPLREISRQDGHAGAQFGFCTEFLVEPNGVAIDVDRLRGIAAEHGAQSIVVVGDETLARLHAHTETPNDLVRKAETLGRLSRVKIEDMSVQHVRLRTMGSGAGNKTALLALANGEGFVTLFASYMAATAPLGEIVKPSAGDIAAAADELNAPDVIVLPNHKNVLLAAQQAKSLARCTIHVVPTTSVAAGVAAAIAFDGTALPGPNLAAMTAAIDGIATVEVTIAQSDRVADGIRVTAGQAIALLDGTLVSAEDEPLAALLAGLDAADAAEADLITLYLGEGVGGDAETLGLSERFEDAEIEVLSGGQPMYQFIASVER